MILVLNILQNLVIMDVKLITAIVLLSVRLVILTTAVTELPSVFRVMHLALLIILIVLLNVRLGLVTLVILNPVVLALKM